MKWYPIETAPRDEEFFAYDPASKTFDVCYVSVTKFGGETTKRVRQVQSNGEYGPCDDEFMGERATLWSPLPAEEPSVE